MNAMVETGRKLKRKAFTAKWAAADAEPSSEGGQMQKVLGPIDVTFLGIGGIIGAGVFVLSGVAANVEAGPAVLLSYIIASVTAILSAFCYTEFAVDTPVAGGAFVYVNMVFGEFAGWVAACNLVLEYTLSAAAVARSFTSYLSTLFGGDADALRVPMGSKYFMLDVPAMLIVFALCGLLAYGTQGGARFNTVVTAVNLAVIAFVLCAGAPYFDSKNFEPFLPFGIHGVFSGTAKVFFSFIGFDSVATVAEECRNPGFDLPMGIISSLLICSVLYSLMSVTICGMVYYTDIDVNAPFSIAFSNVGLGWAAKVVSLGAIAGIVTSMLVSLIGQARVWLVLGRENLVPAWMGKVNSRTQTPLNATVVTALWAGAFALLVDLEALADLVSIGTLSVFLMVAVACLWRRYAVRGEPAPVSLTVKVCALFATALGVSVSFTAKGPDAVTLTFAALFLGAMASLYWQPVVWQPAKFRIPLNPIPPCLAILANLFLITSLGPAAYIRFAVWFVLSLLVYVAYGVHHSREDVSAEVEMQGGAGIPAARGNGSNGVGKDLGKSTAVRTPEVSPRSTPRQQSYAALDQSGLINNADGVGFSHDVELPEA